MTQITEEELTLFIRFSRLCTKLNIAFNPEKHDDILLEVARMSPTETLQEMIADNREITTSPTKEMVDLISEELKKREVTECNQI